MLRAFRERWAAGWRPGSVGVAAIAATVLVALGIGFAILAPLLAGAPRADALPVTSLSPGAIPIPTSGPAGGSASPSLLSSLPPASGAKSSAKPSQLEDQAVSLINQSRKQAHCNSVKNDSHLRSAARSHSSDMAGKSFLSQTGSDGSSFADRIRKAGNRKPLGEDVARGEPAAQAVVNDWLASAADQATLLNCADKSIGVGVAVAKDGTVYWTADFGG
jgi:uncharacterized protein YkwD